MGREAPNDVGGPEDRGLVRGHEQPGGEGLGLSKESFPGEGAGFSQKDTEVRAPGLLSQGEESQSLPPEEASEGEVGP